MKICYNFQVYKMYTFTDIFATEYEYIKAIQKLLLLYLIRFIYSVYTNPLTHTLFLFNYVVAYLNLISGGSDWTDIVSLDS